MTMEQQLYSPKQGKNRASPTASRPDPREAWDAPFSITVRFSDGMGDTHADAFKRAADRWTKVIRGGLSPVRVDGEEIEGLLILADVGNLDGPSGELAEAHPTHFRPTEAEHGPGLPAKGEMVFDRADLDRLAQNGSLVDVITHEMGHVIGIGMPAWFQMVKPAEGRERSFHGSSAMREYARLLGSRRDGEPVPIDAGAHWREAVAGNELMSGVIFGNDNRLSRLTVGGLEDLGYQVDYDRADEYALPPLDDERPAAIESRPSSRVARYHSCKSFRQWVARILPKSALVRR
jgi:hypothetical protein